MDDVFGSMPTAADDTVKSVIRPISEAGRWMKLLAVMMFISGGLAAITIIGLLVAWLPLWMGSLLWKSAKSAEAARMTGSEAEAVESLARLKTYFTVQGVVILIYLVFTVGMIVLAIGFSLTASSG